MKYFMGIDAGTQGARIGIYDEMGKCIAEGTQGWTTDYPHASWAEQDPQMWWDAICSVLEEIMSELPASIRQSIETVSVDATSSTVIPVDAKGKPLRKAIMWMDIRATEEADAINATKHKVLNYCGGADSPEFFIPKILWVKNNEPEIYKKADVFCEQLDWINFKLSGVMTSSICTTTCKANYVKSLGGYSDDFFREIGFKDWEKKLIPEVLDTGKEIGKIKPDIAKKYGINPSMKLVQGGIDAHVGMFGTNAIKDGRLCMIMGTSFCHLGLTSKKPHVKDIWGPYEDAVVDGKWCLEAGQASAAGLIQWFARNFNIITEDMYDVLAYSVTSIPPGSEGLIVCDFFQGNRTPYKDPHAKGIIYGLTMKHTWKHIYRAVLEAIAFGTYNIIDNFEKQDFKIDEIIGCGGVTNDHSFMQIISDVTGKKIIVNKDTQGGVLGCAVIGAAVTCHNGDFQKACDEMVHPKRVVEPNMENHQRYLQIFKKYQALYEQTKILNKM